MIRLNNILEFERENSLLPELNAGVKIAQEDLGIAEKLDAVRQISYVFSGGRTGLECVRKNIFLLGLDIPEEEIEIVARHRCCNFCSPSIPLSPMQGDGAETATEPRGEPHGVEVFPYDVSAELAVTKQLVAKGGLTVRQLCQTLIGHRGTIKNPKFGRGLQRTRIDDKAKNLGFFKLFDQHSYTAMKLIVERFIHYNYIWEEDLTRGKRLCENTIVRLSHRLEQDILPQRDTTFYFHAGMQLKLGFRRNLGMPRNTPRRSQSNASVPRALALDDPAYSDFELDDADLEEHLFTDDDEGSIVAVKKEAGQAGPKCYDSSSNEDTDDDSVPIEREPETKRRRKDGEPEPELEECLLTDDDDESAVPDEPMTSDGPAYEEYRILFSSSSSSSEVEPIDLADDDSVQLLGTKGDSPMLNRAGGAQADDDSVQYIGVNCPAATDDGLVDTDDDVGPHSPPVERGNPEGRERLRSRVNLFHVASDLSSDGDMCQDGSDLRANLDRDGSSSRDSDTTSSLNEAVSCGDVSLVVDSRDANRTKFEGIGIDGSTSGFEAEEQSAKRDSRPNTQDAMEKAIPGTGNYSGRNVFAVDATERGRNENRGAVAARSDKNRFEIKGTHETTGADGAYGHGTVNHDKSTSEEGKPYCSLGKKEASLAPHPGASEESDGTENGAKAKHTSEESGTKKGGLPHHSLLKGRAVTSKPPLVGAPMKWRINFDGEEAFGEVFDRLCRLFSGIGVEEFPAAAESRHFSSLFPGSMGVIQILAAERPRDIAQLVLLVAKATKRLPQHEDTWGNFLGRHGRQILKCIADDG
jgi:hypothetical protein